MAQLIAETFESKEALTTLSVFTAHKQDLHMGTVPAAMTDKHQM